MKYTFVKDYKDDHILRKSLNELTESTFNFNFEEWYANGFWKEKYIPYSLADGDKIVANVSVNLMDFDLEGTEKHYIQIGTVMTDKNYRGQGLSKYLIEKIIEEYKDKTDGIYLFGNDSVLDFYPKFNFTKSEEYQYSKNINFSDCIKKIKHIDMSEQANFSKMLHAVENSICNSRFEMKNNLELIAFWLLESKKNSIYYLDEEEAYVIADLKGEELFIHQVIADHKIDLEKAIKSFDSEIKKATLGFTPYDTSEYHIDKLHKNDCTLFILGRDLENIENRKLMFPTLSHA